jgi:hypothetical protein
VLWIHKFDANEVATVGMKIVSPLGTALQRLWDGDLKRWRVHTSSQAMARSHTPPPASAPTARASAKRSTDSVVALDDLLGSVGR